MKNLYPRLTQAPVDAPVTYSNGIYKNSSPCADTSTGYAVSKNQNSKKWWLLPKLAALLLLVQVFAPSITLHAQAPTVTNPWATIASDFLAGAITADANENLYIGNRNAISKVTPTAGVTQYWSFLGVTNSAALCTDASGNIYSANADNTVSKVTPSGTLTSNWATLSPGSSPRDMALDASGNLYVANSDINYISKITSAGVANNTWAEIGAGATSILTATNGDVYVSAQNPNRIDKITSAGVITTNWASIPSGLIILDMTFDANGNIFATVINNVTAVYTVCKIMPNGTINSNFATLTGATMSLKIICDDKRGVLYLINQAEKTVSKVSMIDGTLTQQWVSFSGFQTPRSGIIVGDNLFVAISALATNNIYVAKIELPSITFNQTQPTCANSTNGGLRAIPPTTCGAGFQYLWTPGGATTDTISNLAPGTYSVRVVCGTDTLNKSITLMPITVVSAPSTSNQSLCNGATVADLVATPTAGNSIVWYATATGGAALANSTPLVNATKYYAAQVTPSNCESSTRAADSVTIQATVAAKADSSYCNGSNIAVNFVGASGNTYNWTATQNGTGIAASGTGNTSFTGVNNTNAVVTDTVIVSSSFNTCTPQKDTFAISVLPTPKVDSIANMWVCPSTVVPAINFTTPITGGTVGYKWTNNNTAIGLAASGFGNIPSFTSPATTQNTIRSTINVRPYILKSATDTCFGALRTFTITSSLPPFVLLGGRFQTRVIYTGSKTINQLDISPGAGFTLNYYYQPTGGTALPGTTPVVDDTTYYVTRALAGCESNPRKIVPVNRIANDTIVFCKPDSVANLTATTAANITARWYNEPSFGDTLASSTPITAALDTLYVEEYGMDQPGRFAVISNRVPVIVMVNQTPANVVATTDKAVCNNSTVAAVNFSTTNTVGATTYAWTNNKTSIGLAASGTGNIASFTAVNNGTVPDTATIIVTPTITNLGLSCEGIKDTFLIIVNPTAAVNTVSNQVVCNGSAVTSINFGTTNTGGTVTYAWTNNTTSIGLAASGNENIATFNGVNTGTAPVTATITVTPTFTNGGVSCAGSSQTFSITVNPTANINALNDHVLCNGANFTEVVPTTTATGGTVTYAWTNNTTSIGLAASGTGNVPAFTTVNNGTAPVTATVIVTPTFANGGVNCAGTADTFYITVNPTATVNVINNQTVCNGATVAAVTPTTTATGGTVTYAWTNDNATIGLAASGTGTIPAFTAINAGTAPVTATINVTPTFTNGGLSCTGTVRTYTITVNPTATVNTVSNQVVCNGSAVAAVNFSTTATGGTVTYAWTNSNTTIGLSASGSGNIASFTATNNGTAPVTATITVTPTFTNDGVSCQGTAQTFTITVNPTAVVNTVTNKVVCNGSAIAAINFGTTATGGTVVYNWTNNNTSFGLAASGTGNIASFNATNNTNAPQTATITVTPVFSNGGVSCTGTATSFTITVNPEMIVNAISSQVLCNNASTTAVNFASPTTGGTIVYNWTNSNTAIGLAASGSGNIASFTATNSSNAPISGTITVIATYTNAGISCTSAPQTFAYTVNPTATVNAINNQAVCNGAAVSAVIFASATTGGTVTYAWTNNNSSIGLAASGTGNIASFNVINNSNVPVTATITVTPTFTNGGVSCTGTAQIFTVTVNPTAVVNAVSNQTLCAGSTNSAVTFSSPVAGTTYSWTNSNPSIGLAASGTGNIPSFVAVNPSPNAINATITVTPNTAAGCIGQSITYAITVNGLSVAPTAIINPTPIVCANNAFATLNVSGGTLGTGAVWKWYADSLNTVSIGSGATLSNIPVAKTTTYFVRAEGTCNNTAAASVVVQRANLVSHVRQHWSDVLLFDNSSRNFVAWQWYKNGVAVSGATLQQYSESSALVGTYHVVATDRNGAQFISCPQTITATTFTGLRISLFPNPADIGSNVSIATSFNASELQGANIIVSDINGNVIRQITQVLPNNTMQAPTVRGMYVVTLTLQNGMKYSTNLLTK